MAASHASSGGLHIEVDIAELADIEADELVAVKRQLLALFKSLKFEINSLDSAIALFPALRIYHFSEKELYFHKDYLLYDLEQFLKRVSSIGVVSPRNESRCLIYLWRRLQAQKSGLSADLTRAIEGQLQGMMQVLAQSFPTLDNPIGNVLKDDSSEKLHREVATRWRHAEINSKLKLASFGFLRGLTTTSDIDHQEFFLRLPVENILSHHSARQSPLRMLFDVEGLPNDVILALFVIFEFYNDNSPWRYYLDMLPMEFDTALYYTGEEIEQLQDMAIAQEIRQMQEKTRTVYDSVVPVLIEHDAKLFHPKIFTLENFIWAQSVLDSRGIRLNVNGEATLCLLPLVDAINGATISFLEGTTSVSTDPNDNRESYSIRSLLPVKQGEQIFMNYGAFSNRELLLYYGYVVQPPLNVYDTYSFDLDIDDGPAGEIQAALLQRLGLSLDQHISVDGSISDACLMTFHLLMMDHEELFLLLSIEDNQELGSRLYQEAKHSTVTKQSLSVVLSNLVDRVIIPSPPSSHHASSSSSDTSSPTVSPTRMEHLMTFCTAQRAILERAIQRLGRM